ncbi:MAG: hypothetical protein U9Q79_03480 [Candidatus Hydrogenedentes bacterium]|nr:hypothetical protein [Candidatus Hydrogenedentota bacterium]
MTKLILGVLGICLLLVLVDLLAIYYLPIFSLVDVMDDAPENIQEENSELDREG